MANLDSAHPDTEVVDVTARASSVGRPRCGRPLDDGDQVALRAYINEYGLRGTAERLGLPASTIANAAAGCGLREGSRLLLRDRLHRRGR